MAVPSSLIPVLDASIVHEKRNPIVSKLGPSTSNTAPQVRIVQPHEYKEAAACLAEAFREDKVVRYAIDTPDRTHLSEEERFEIHKKSLEYVTYAHCLNGLVLAIGEGYDCVALWLPPGKNIDDWWTILRSGMWRMGYMLSAEGKERFFTEFLPLLSRSKAEILGDRDSNSWYLNYVGTRASARGKGYAKKLITYVTDIADKQGLPCYLESSHDINLIIYGKMGFELKKQIFLNRDDVRHRMDVMVREPKSNIMKNEKQN